MIAPFEITLQHDTNPVVSFAWPRPDFDLASHELLIGLLAAIYPADPREPKQWTQLFHTPPSPDELGSAFEPFANAFVLDGDGSRFLQDSHPLDGEELPIHSLLIETPGANAIKLNKDLFIKRAQARVVSRSAAAMALYTLQQFAPSGGRGYRTSLRGGGPLVTLALPDGGGASRATLWRLLWLNTPATLRLDVAEKPPHSLGLHGRTLLKMTKSFTNPMPMDFRPSSACPGVSDSSSQKMAIGARAT